MSFSLFTDHTVNGMASLLIVHGGHEASEIQTLQFKQGELQILIRFRTNVVSIYNVY